MTQTTAVAVPQQTTAPSLLLDPVRFDHLVRVGKMLALSPLFPAHLRAGGQDAAIANGALVLNMANRLNEDPLTVAQNIYFVGGRPGWNTSYMIGKANQHGVFRDPIDWEIAGKGETLSVTAFGILARTGRRVAVTCDMEMAKKEGWTKNAKYQSIPEQMLRYRSAAFLIRLYCPEVMIGIPLQVEQELAVRDVTPDGEGAGIVANEEPPIEAKAEPVREAKPAAAKQTETAKPAKEVAQEPEAQAASEEQAEPTEADLEQFRGLLDLMLADLEQNGPDETEEVYAPQIEQLRAVSGDLYRLWSDAVTAAREAAATGGDA